MPRNIMLIPHIPKIPHPLPFPRKHRNTERMHGRIPKPLIVEAPHFLTIKVLKVRSIRLPTEEIEVSDLKVTEKLTVIVLASVPSIVDQPAQIRIRVDKVRSQRHELARALPQGRETPRVVQDVHVEAVDEVVVAQEAEGVVGDGAEEVHVGLDAPVVGVRGEGGVGVEEAAVPAAHGAVGGEVAFSDAEGAEVGEGGMEALRGDVGRGCPVRFWDEVVGR